MNQINKCASFFNCYLRLTVVGLLIAIFSQVGIALAEPVAYMAEEFPTLTQNCSPPSENPTCLSRQPEQCNTISVIDLETGSVSYEDPCPIVDCAGTPNGSAVIDDCGVCDGDGTSCLDCTGEVNGSKTYDACGDCGGAAKDATECQNQCVWLAAWAENSAPQGGKSLYEDQAKFRYTGTEEFPSCFYNRFRPSCKTHFKNSHAETWTIISNQVQLGGWCRDVTASTLADFLGVPAGKRDGVLKNLSATHYFMNSNCEYVEAREDVALCGYAGVSYSPISLIWEKNASLESDQRVVAFSINPTRPNDYTLWKASNVAPLLVYDPENSGAVKSASQLFGNFTFGGKPNHSTESGPAKDKKPWDHGYQALATLDSDQDGKISGNELASLSLWFDQNRNAVVDSGELRKTKGEGIVSLFFNNPRKNGDSKDLVLEIGYERLVDGELISGRSVDWFAETFASKKEASDVLAQLFNTSYPVQALQENPLDFAPNRNVNHRQNISGFWIWHLKEKGSFKHPGVFAFEQASRDGKITGYNVVESQLEKNKFKLKSNAQIAAISGKVTSPENGNMQIVMEVSIGDSIARSLATLSPDGMKLMGKTIQTHSDKLGPSAATLDYEWVAIKVLN